MKKKIEVRGCRNATKISAVLVKKLKIIESRAIANQSILAGEIGISPVTYSRIVTGKGLRVQPRTLGLLKTYIKKHNL